MKKTIILKPECIVQYKSMIGLVLHDENDYLTFSTGHKIYRIKEEDVTIPSLSDIEYKLSRDEDLRYLATEYDIVETQYRDSVTAYLSYIKNYN